MFYSDFCFAKFAHDCYMIPVNPGKSDIKLHNFLIQIIPGARDVFCINKVADHE